MDAYELLVIKTSCALGSNLTAFFRRLQVV